MICFTGDIVVNKKEFHASKQAIALNLVNTNKIVVSEQQSRLYNQPIYDDKYIKTKVKTFSSTISTLFSDNENPRERNHYIGIAAICIDSVLKVDNKNYPQVYLEQCKHKIKKRKLVDFIDVEVDLSSNDSDDLDGLND